MVWARACGAIQVAHCPPLLFDNPNKLASFRHFRGRGGASHLGRGRQNPTLSGTSGTLFKFP